MEKAPKAIWSEFIYGGHILSLGNISVLLSLSILTNKNITLPFAIIVYMGTLAVYKLDRKHDIDLDINSNPGRSKFIKNDKFINTEIIISTIIVFALTAIYGNLNSFLLITLLMIFGFGYSSVFKNISKRVSGFKNFFVPIPYALLPLLYYLHQDYAIDSTLTIFSLFVYLRLWPAVLFYDIKDMESDQKNKIGTIATMLGAEQTIVVANIINYASVMLIVYAVLVNMVPIYSLMFILLTIYYHAYSIFSKKSKDLSTFSHIYCDGEYILWYPLIIIGKYLWN